MNDSDWYEITQGPLLRQGDILFGCPVFTATPNWTWPIPEGAPLDIDFLDLDVVVLTQSCDLENDKVEDALLAQVIAWPEAVATAMRTGKTHIKSREFRKKLVEGDVPGLSLLHKRDQEPRLAWSVVDFHHLYTLPKAFLCQFATACPSRIRLRSPYREHLAQAFARYFMRVGLPHDARAFEKEGDVKV
jgi:hypothetical protein